MNYLDQKLQRAMRGGDVSGMQEVASQAAKYGSRDIMRQAERGLREYAKAQEKAQRELARAQREQERQARQQARDAERAARQQASDYKGDAVAFFTRGSGAGRKVIPITAPSGGVMKKWGDSGVLWDSNTGLPYAMDPKTMAMTPIDPEADGKTVVKDGHVYKVVEGLPWKWVGFDPSKVGNDPALAKELAAKTADAKREADMASDKAAATRKLIADNEKAIRALEKEQLQASSEDHKRLQGEIDQLKGKNKGLRERLELEQIDAHKKAAYRQQVESANDQRLADDLASRQKLAYQGDPKGGLGLQSALDRISKSQQSATTYNNDPVAALMGAITDRSIATAKSLAPDSLKIADSITNAWNANQKARTDAKIDAWGRNKSIEQTNALLAKMDATGTYKLTGKNAKGQPTGLLHDPDASPELKAKIQDFVNKTGITEIPRSWMTPEAQEARANANQFGLYDVKLPQNFVLSKGAITTTRDEQSSIWGIPMPWTSKGKPVDVGTYQFDRNGVPFIELNKDNRLSPSQLSGSPLDGVKEYMPMPAEWAEQFKPRKPSENSLSSLNASQRREVMDNYKNELATYQQTAKDAWAGQKMDAERFNDTLTRWTVATPAQRQEMIAELDPSQANIPASERRLNTRALFEAGMISAQEGRLLERAFYGTDPVMPSVNEAWQDWQKNTAKGQEYTQKLGGILKDKQLDLFGQSTIDFVGSLFKGGEAQRRATNLTADARQAFLSEYLDQNRTRVDFTDPAFTAARDKALKDVPFTEWVNKGFWDIADMGGSVVGMLQGTGAILGDGLYNKVTDVFGSVARPLANLAGETVSSKVNAWLPEGGRNLLTDQEKQIIGSQTMASVRNMSAAVADRITPIRNLSFLTSPTGIALQALTGTYAVDDAMKDVWDGKTAGALNRAWDDYLRDVDSGNLTKVKYKAHEEKISRLTGEFNQMRANASGWTSALGLEDGAGYRMSYENSMSDPRSAIAQFAAAYQQTRDPRLAAQARAASFSSQSELEIQRAAADYATMNGAINETTPFGGFKSAIRGGYVAPLTEQAIELGVNLLGIVSGGALYGVKAVGAATRVGSNLNKAAKAVTSFSRMGDNIADSWRALGKIEAAPGISLTRGQQIWNSSIDFGKQSLVSGGGEFFQEAVASFGEAGASFGDAINQGIHGAILGVGMGPVHAIGGGAVSLGYDATKQILNERAQTKALTQFVADYNKHNNTGTQLTLDVARQAQNYQSPQFVATLNTQRKDLMVQLADVNARLNALPADPQVRPGNIPFTPNPQRQQLLSEKSRIENSLQANLLDTAAVSEMSINTAREINALPPGQREVVDAALRAANGVPLSVSQESTLLGHQTASGKPAAYTYGDDIVLTDEFREEIKQVAPETAKAPVLRKTQAERDAELRAKYGGVFRMVNGRPVFIADKKPASATTPVQPSAPTPTTPSVSTQPPAASTTPSAPAPSAPSAPTVPVQPTTPAPATPQTPVGETPVPAPVTPSTPTNTAGPQVPAPIQVTPPVTQNFQTPDGAQVTGTFEKQPDGTWQQTSPEAPIFTITPENTQFFQTLEDKAAYALNPQTPDAVQPGEFGQEGYTATTPADSANDTTSESVTTTPDPAAAATPPPLPETETADVFTQPVNRGTALLMLQTAAPWVSSAPLVVRSPRFFTRGNRVVDAKTYAELPKQERARYTPSPSPMFAHQGKVYVDETALVEYLGGVAPEARQEKLKAALREEVIHIATMNVRKRDQIIQDWQALPDAAKQRVVETYFTAELEAAGGDWTQVEVDEFQAGAEFWRMYLNAVNDGRTTEQVDMASEVADYAATNPTFAQRLKETLQDIARWLREELLGQLDPDTRAEFEQTAAKIDAEVAKLDAMLGITPQAATPAAEAASPMKAPVEQANAPPVSAVEPAETIDTPAAPLTRLPEKAAPRNQAFVPKPAVGAMKWKQEALNTSLTSAAGSFGYKIVDTGIPSQYTAYGETLNYGTALYDKLNPGNEIGQWIDAMNAGTNPAGNAIIQAASEPGLHRVWYGHDFFTNVDNVAAEFGWSEVPSYIIQLFKDSLTRSGLPLPGVELLVQSGTVSDRVATDWLSTNIGEVFGGGLSFLGTYKLYRAAKSGRLSKPKVIFATVGIGLKLVSGVMTAQPFLILSGLADTAILVTNLDQVKAAFKKGIQEFNKKPQAVRDLYERVAAPTAVAPVSQESSTPQDGREVKLPGSYPGDAGSTPAPATTLPVQPVQSVEATPPPLPPEDVVTPEQEVVTDEATPPPLPPEPTEPAAAPTIKMAEAAKTLGVTPKELLRLVKAAVIPAERKGNNYLFTQEALDAYAADRAAKQAPVLEKLAAVAGNTATEEDVADLRQRGLVDIYRGQRVINQKGYDLMDKAGMAPRLTRNQRIEEIDSQLGPVEKPASDIPLHPRVTKSGRLYLVRGPQGGTPAQIPITDDAVARTEANRIAAEFDAKEAELEARAAEMEPEPEPTPEDEGLPELSDEDAKLVPKFFNLFVSQMRDFREARERGESTPESLDRLVTQAVAVAKRLGMANLHPGTLLMNMSRLPEGPLMRSQAAFIDAVHDVLQDGTRDIAPADLTLKAGIASPAGFTNRDSAPLSWAQMIQLGALKATPRPDGSLRVRMGKTPEQMKADAEQAELEAMQQEYLDDLRAETGNLDKAMEDASASGFELLDAIQMAGGLPSPTSESAESHRGELTTLFESAKAMGKGAYGGKGIFVSRIFRKDAPDLDRLAQSLRGHGFDTFTPSDVLDLVEARFTENRPMYGTTVDFDDGLSDRAVAAKPRVRLANASVTTEAGPIFLKKAHHGTPHKVYRFSLEKIGTGEGAQAYGWGLYFAENKKVAESYRDEIAGWYEVNIDGKWEKLSSNDPDITILRDVFENGGDWLKVKQKIYDELDSVKTKPAEKTILGARSMSPEKRESYYKKILGLREDIKNRFDKLFQKYGKKQLETRRPGNVYAVELDVDDADLLDWDAPLSAQSEKVQAALQAVSDHWMWQEAIAGKGGERVGGALYSTLRATFPDAEFSRDGVDASKKASEALLAAGIPGIRYLDGGSRGPVQYKYEVVDNATGDVIKSFHTKSHAIDFAAGEDYSIQINDNPGTYNFVIFDENLIRIVAENGEPVGNAEVVKNLMADSDAAGMLREDGIPGALSLDAATGLAESGARPGAQPAQGAAPARAVDARQGELGIPAENAFSDINYTPARIWGLQALADRFLQLRNFAGGQPIQPPIFRRDFGQRQAAFREAAQAAESLYRETLANVDAAYADRRGRADSLLPRLPEVRALFTDANGEMQLLGSRPVELDAGEPLFAKPRRTAPHQLDLFTDNYNQTATPWTPSWQAKEPAKADAPALSLEQQTEGVGRIEDFGEKLEGARKDLWQRYTDMVMAELPADARDITLAKYLPEPDYEAMIASGMEPARVAAVKALRDVIPRKPSSGYKLAIWTKMVRDLRPLIQRLIDPANPIPLDKFQLAIADSREIRDTVRFYEDLGWPHFTQAKGWKLKQSEGYIRWNGELLPKSTVVSYMEQDFRASTELSSVNPPGDWRQGYAAVLQKFRDYLDAQAAQAKEPKKIDFQIYSDTQTRDVFIGKKGASGVIRLQTGFASAKEASNWLTDHYNDLALKWEGMRQDPVLRRATNEPRTGPKRREGDVTPEMFTEAFGFRGVQFGNYVEGDRRQRDLNNAFDAFMDLSEALGIPAKALSFDGSLGLAFGARGRGGKRPAAAHYEPGEVVINLTKNSGPGSLAHEWFHALDNYFARLERTGSTAPKDLDEWATRNINDPRNVRPEVMEAFRAIRNSLGGDLDKRSRALDSTRSAPYYSQTIEKAARAFETYVIDRLGKSSVTNDYLANIDPTSEAYPRPNEMDGGIRQAFDTLFTTLDTRQGERGTMLFAKPRRQLAGGGFYLKSAEVLDSKIQGKQASLEQVKALLENPQNGIKAEELKWTGVVQEAERLAKENNGKVPKEDLLAFLAADGAVELREETLSDEKAKALSFEEWVQKQGYGPEAIEDFGVSLRRSYDAFRQGNSGRIGSTKYSKYKLPGGENYREVVLAMPEDKRLTELDDALQRGENRAEDWAERIEREAKTYRSSHFDTPNYVAHMRLNERTDTEGRPGLFIEELQSDRHQQGREKGYIDSDTKNWSAKPTEKIAHWQMWSVVDSSGEIVVNQIAAKNEAEAILIAQSSAQNKGRIPDAPFRTTWPLQLFKRALRDAVASGKDWIGWTTGETQAERFDLSKQLDAIQYDGDSIYVKRTGEAQFDAAPLAEGVQPADLEKYIGKEAAKKLMALPEVQGFSEYTGPYTARTLEGENLKVGGEGMVGFYDNMVPKEVAKYVKQWGGKVEKSAIGQEITEDDLGMEGLEDATSEELAEFEATGKVVGETVPIWRVDITPQMRESVEDGQPLFAKPRRSAPSSSLPGNYPDTLDIVIRSTKVAKLRLAGLKEGEATVPLDPTPIQAGRQPDFTPVSPLYKAAKHGGDPSAALEISEMFVNQKMVDELQSRLDSERPVILVPVRHADPGLFHNALPAALATSLKARIPNSTVDTGIVKVGGMSNTSVSTAQRMGNIQAFDGGVDTDAQYVVVDDVFTSGNTLTALIDHIVRAGGEVVAATAIADSQSQNYLKPRLQDVAKLLDRAGLTSETFQRDIGFPIEALTGSEIYRIANLERNWRGPAFIKERFRNRVGVFAQRSRLDAERTGQADGQAALFAKPTRSRGDLIPNLNALPEGVTAFSGAGLVEIGLQGIVQPTFAVEYNPAIAQAYRAAWGDHVQVADIRSVSMEAHKGKFHYHASPVCKNSSLLKSAAKGGGEKDLDIESARAVALHIRQIEPEVVTIENVPDYRKTTAAQIIRDALEEQGYTFDEGVYNAADYGAPTARRRYLLRAVKGMALLPEPAPVRGPGWWETVKDIIEDLPDDSIERAGYIQRSLPEQGIDLDDIQEPLLVSGTTLFKKVAFARPTQPAFTFKATPATVDRILLPDGRVKRVTAKAKARMTGVPDSFPLPEDEKVALTIIGNGVPPALVRNVFGPVIEYARARQQQLPLFAKARRPSPQDIPYSALPRPVQKEARETYSKPEETLWRLEDVSTRELMDNSLAGMTGDVLGSYDIEALERSIEKNGIRQPILMHRNPDGSINLEGNHRVYAASQIGLETVPAYVLQNPEAILSAKPRRGMRDTTAELFGDETPFNLVGETLPPSAPAQPDIVVDAQAREQAFRQSGREDVGDLFGEPAQAERIYWTRKDTPRLAAWDRVPGQGNPETTSTGYISGKHSDKIAARAAERGDIGVLVTPLMPSYLAHAAKYPYMAVDNGVFSRVTPFNPDKFRQLVDRVAANPEAKERTLFVVAPDVVGDAAKTLEQFTEWARWIQSRGLPVALAAQNGLEYMQDQIPWDLVDVLFIGGSTEWKIGQFDTAKELSQWASLWMTAHDLGIPIHMGRVNTNDRISGIAQQIGVSTVDGTYLAFAPDKNLPKLEAMLDKLNVQGLDLAGQTFPELGRYPSTQEIYDIAVDPETVYLDDLGGYAPAAAQINAIRLELGLPTLATDRAQLQLPLFAKMTRAANKAKTMPVAQVLNAYERTPDPQAVQMGLDIALFPGKREVRAQIQFSDPADLERALEMTDQEDAIDLPEWVNAAIETAVPGFKSSGWAYLNAEDTTDTTAMISVGEDVPVPDNIVPLFAKPRVTPQQDAESEIKRRFPNHRYITDSDAPVMLKTGEPVILKMHHATRRPRQLMKTGRFNPKFLGDTHGAPNDRLGWYFSSQYFIGDDGEYVGNRGEVLPFYIVFNNPLVLEDISFVENKKETNRVEELKDKGSHDGIIAIVAGSTQLGGNTQRPNIRKLYEKAVDLTSDTYRNLTVEQQEKIEAEDDILRNWIDGKTEPWHGGEVLKKAQSAIKLLDQALPGFEKAISLENRGTNLKKGDGIAAQTWWAVVPADQVGKIKSADPVTYDATGAVIPLSERFNPESDSILFAKARKPRPSSLLAETKSKVVAGTAVGTRNPTGKAAQEAGTDRSALVDLASMRRDPELYRKNAVLLADFPLVAGQVPEAAKIVRDISAPVRQAREQFLNASKRLEDARNELKAELARRQGVRPNKIKVAEVDKLEQGDTKVAEDDRVIKRHLAQIAKARKIQDAFRDKRDKKQAEFDANSKALLAGKKFPIELADRVYAALKTAAVRNLELLIELFPADLRDTARLWYDGANIIAQDFAARYNTTLNRSAAVLAVFSPQKDWFMNVALGQRMMNIWANHQNTRFDDAMAKQYLMRAGEPEPQWDKKTDDYKRDAKGDLVYTKGAKPIRDEEGNITGWENWDNEKAQEKFEKAQKDLAMMRGKKLSELEPEFQARFIRMWSEVYDAPGFPVVTPAGTFGNNKLSEKGNEQRLAWGSYVTIEKAIAILTAPAASEMQVISNELGVQHKVRSFYNNIVDPANADGHVTMDTHAIAAILWQALSGNSPEVSMNFGGGGASGNSNLGISGLYPAFAEAYREVAAEFGLLPREVQSITWESVRLLFPAKFKSQKANVAKVREVWDQHEQGTITTQQAHDRIYQLVDEWKRRSTLAGQPGKTAAAAVADGSGVGRPDWAEVARSGDNNSQAPQGAADAGGLPDRGRRGDGTGRSALGRRGAGRDAGLLPATPKGRQSGAVLGAKPRRTPPPLPPMEKRIEASLDAIENWNNVLRAAEEKPAGSVRKLAGEIREAMPYEIWRGYQNIFRGRLDVADALAPGVKAILQAAQQEEALAQIGVNAVVDGLRRELQKAFGDPAFWNKNRARLKEATRLLLPTASYLQPQRAGVDGGFEWREFERRSGTISQVEARKLRLRDGEWFQYDGRTYRLGDFLPDEKAFVLLEPISVEMQQAIYEEFWQNFPEALPILDRWITPDLKDAYTVGLGSTMSVEFNREALLSFMNEWPQDLKDAFGDLLPEVPRVEGYTPDIAAQRSIIATIARLLGIYKSPGRRFKTGALREAGNVKNLVDGFSTRAMEAHREKIRMRMREGIIEKAVVLRDDVPAENIGDYVALEDVFSSIVKAVEAARLLDKKAYPHLSKGLNPKDQVQLMKLVGDAARLNGIEQMVHKKVYRELMLSMARAQTEGILLRTLNFFLRGAKLGKLAAGSVGINWIGNQILTLTQAMNRMFAGITHLMVLDSRGASVNTLEALFLLRGLITDRAPNTLNQSRIGDLIPRELFDSTTALSSLDAGADYGNMVDDIKRNGILRGPAQGLVNAFKQGGISASILYAVHYSGGDAAVKQQSAYAAYRARAEVAANEAKIKSGRSEWMRNWIQKQVRENTAIHREVMDAARLYFMDYANVPAWMDPSASLPEEKVKKFLKEHGLWFIKWPYNFVRFMKRMGLDGAIETFSPSSTKQERARGLANMLTLAAIAYGGAALLSGDDEEDPIIGSRFDAEGKAKDRDQDTSSRMNLSALGRKTQLGRMLATALRMAGVNINDDLTSHRGDDYWMYYQNMTWMKEGLLMGRAVRGDMPGFLRDAGAYISDLTALGILSRMVGIAKVGSIDAKKSPVNLASEAFFEALSSPINPSALTEYINNMTDPVVRRTTSNKSLDFTMGPLESIMAKVPGLRKNLPVAGDPITPARLTLNFDRAGYMAREAKKIRANEKLTTAEKDAALANLSAQVATPVSSSGAPIDLRELLFGMGVNPAKVSDAAQTTRNIAGDLARLQAMGAGPESVRVYDEKLPSGETRTYITYPDPDNVAVRDPFLSLFKIATGVNIRPFPKPKSLRQQPSTLTPELMFNQPQANLTLPRQ